MSGEGRGESGEKSNDWLPFVWLISILPSCILPMMETYKHSNHGNIHRRLTDTRDANTQSEGRKHNNMENTFNILSPWTIA